MNQARISPTAVLLSNGEVLVAGGGISDFGYGICPLASAELYNPATGTWTYTGSMHSTRYLPTMTLLTNGEVLVAGGLSDLLTPTAELYNPSTGTWTLTGSLNVARYQATAALLQNGQALVVGGDGNTSPLTSAELYNPSTGKWTATGSMNTGHGGGTATLLQNGQVLVAGGAGPSNPTNLTSTELYTP